MSSTDKKHYFLISGEVIFLMENNVSAVRLNALVTSTDTSKNFPMRLLAKAQQSLQANFTGKMEGSTYDVQDVVIHNVNHLGHMSNDEFVKAPPGTKIVEVANES